MKIRYISEGIGDKTLWQWIRGENIEKELAWKDSWSQNRKIKDELKQKQEKTDELVKIKKEAINRGNLSGNQETTSVLCQCGQIIHTPVRFEAKRIKCTACNHVVHVPKLEEFN